MAELLVRAKEHHLDCLTAEEVNNLSIEKLKSYNARSEIGDIEVVKPNGSNWGGEECLPYFVVIKVPDMTFEEAEKYEECIIEDEIIGYDDVLSENITRSKTVKNRKYNIKSSIIVEAKLNGDSVINKTKSEILSNIIDKTL